MRIFLFHLYFKPNPDFENMSLGFRKLGHEVWIGQLNEDGNIQWHDGNKVVEILPGPQSDSEKEVRVPVVHALHRQWRNLVFTIRLRKFFRQKKPDIVHINPAILPWLIPLGMPEKIFFVFDVRQLNEGVRSGFSPKLRESKALVEGWICARIIYDHTCFNHAGTAVHMLGENWQRWATVVPVGLNEKLFKIDHSQAPKRPGEPVRFIYVGSITRFRELEIIFLAAQKLKDLTQQFRVVMVGPDIADGYYHRLVDELDLSEVLEIRPPVPYDEIPELLAQYDVGLAYVPQRPTWDYQPTIKALEYRAIGLPILSSDVVSHREIVSNGVNGLLVNNCPEELADAIQAFVQDRDFLSLCKRNAQQMRKGLSRDDVARAYEEQVYDKLKKSDFIT